MIYKKGKLNIDGFNADFLAKKFNTPLYCYSLKKIKENILNFTNNFNKINPLICFAVKANTNVKILKEIKNFNLGADVVSIGELMKAIKAGIADKEGYAFDDYVIRNGKPEKRALPIDAIRKIAELDLEKDTALFRDRNIFMMSFLLNGMSYVDMAHLKLSNIADGRIRYSRKKTDEPYNIKIHDQLKPLLAYFTTGKKRSDYLLNVVKSENPIESYNQIVWARKRYNDNLKKLAELAGIQENITSYAARHSFASGANEMGIPLTAISQMLGHKRISTTQAYLANLRKSKMDEYQDEIFGQLSEK